MAVTKTVGKLAPGIGSGDAVVQNLAVTANVGAVAVRLPSGSTSFAPTASAGIIRIKSATIGTNATFLVNSITGTDGTTTINLVGAVDTASSAGIGIDRIYHFLTELNLTSITINITVGTANSTVDAEVVYAI